MSGVVIVTVRNSTSLLLIISMSFLLFIGSTGIPLLLMSTKNIMLMLMYLFPDNDRVENSPIWSAYRPLYIVHLCISKYCAPSCPWVAPGVAHFEWLTLLFGRPDIFAWLIHVLLWRLHHTNGIIIILLHVVHVSIVCQPTSCLVSTSAPAMWTWLGSHTLHTSTFISCSIEGRSYTLFAMRNIFLAFLGGRRGCHCPLPLGWIKGVW